MSLQLVSSSAEAMTGSAARQRSVRASCSRSHCPMLGARSKLSARRLEGVARPVQRANGASSQPCRSKEEVDSPVWRLATDVACSVEVTRPRYVAGWKKVTDAVHAKDGKIFLQLWHMGRQAHSSFNDGKQVVSSTATQLIEGRLRNSDGEYTTYEMPRALETDEIAGIVEDYRHAAELAKQAGFNGVEIHSANGYLIDQFLQSSFNKRTDKYGGSIENRARILFEIVDAIKTVWPSDRIACRVSPNGVFGGMGSADNYETFMYIIEQLSKHNLAYLALLDAHSSWVPGHGLGRYVTLFDAKSAFKGPVLANVAYTRDTAEGALRSGAVDLVSFGRPFLSNPDLAERFKNDWPLEAEAPHEVWWDASKGAEGYTTYKPYSQQ